MHSAVLNEGRNCCMKSGIKRRAAAERRALGIDFRRTNGDFIRFQVVDHTDGARAAAAVPEAAATEVVAAVVSSDLPPKVTKPRGRPKKAS
jgi:hypothetical protein